MVRHFGHFTLVVTGWNAALYYNVTDRESYFLGVNPRVWRCGPAHDAMIIVWGYGPIYFGRYRYALPDASRFGVRKPIRSGLEAGLRAIGFRPGQTMTEAKRAAWGRA